MEGIRAYRNVIENILEDTNFKVGKEVEYNIETDFRKFDICYVWLRVLLNDTVLC
jgi:hypothetical protein